MFGQFFFFVYCPHRPPPDFHQRILQEEQDIMNFSLKRGCADGAAEGQAGSFFRVFSADCWVGVWVDVSKSKSWLPDQMIYLLKQGPPR